MTPRRFISLAPLALLASCEIGSRDLPTAPGPSITAHRFAARWSPWSEPVNLGPVINSDGLEQDPTLSPDGLSLYFASDRPGGYGIWVSHRACRRCPWNTPVKVRLVPDDFEGGLGPTQAVGAPALSHDGHLLFFSRCVDCSASHFPGNSDIFVARRSDTNDDLSWGTPVPLGPEVNTSANEDHPVYLQNAEHGAINLYFCRTEPGSSRFDIYAAAVTRGGETRGPAALVSELSLPGVNDVAPTLRADGLAVLFQSNRPGGIGTRADLWVSTRRSVHEPWSTPQNLGTPVNTSAAELHPSLSRDGRTLLFASDRGGGNDIWMSTRAPLGDDNDDRDDDGDDQDDDPAPRFSDWSAPVNLGASVNTAAGEFGSFISKDGLSLYFTCDGRCSGTVGDFDTYVSQRATIDAPWGPPTILGPNINTTFAENAPTITADGRRMYFTSNRPGFGGNDIWVSRRRDKRDDFAWEAPVNLGSAINTAANDAGGVLFEDDETESATLYFTSNRPGGLGLNDMYASILNPDGTFGPPTLVTELSSPFDDQQPAIRRDGLEMFLGSNRLGTLGLIDLWVATRARTTDPWSAPLHLGPVVNSAGPDGRPGLSFKGTELYFQSVRPEGFGAFDLYVTTRSRLGEPDDEREHENDNDRDHRHARRDHHGR